MRQGKADYTTIRALEQSREKKEYLLKLKAWELSYGLPYPQITPDRKPVMKQIPVAQKLGIFRESDGLPYQQWVGRALASLRRKAIKEGLI